MTRPAEKRFEIISLPGESAAQGRARATLTPSVLGATTVQEYVHAEGVDLTALSTELTRQAKAVQSGDLSRAEEMLTAQAHTLDAIFNQLAARASNAEYLPQMETFLRLALRAQSQARATWEAVSAIQNPPIAGYIQQANIAAGHQQVNNGTRVRETERTQSQQAEGRHELLQDSRAPGTTFRSDPSVAAVGAVHRPKDARG